MIYIEYDLSGLYRENDIATKANREPMLRGRTPDSTTGLEPQLGFPEISIGGAKVIFQHIHDRYSDVHIGELRWGAYATIAEAAADMKQLVNAWDVFCDWWRKDRGWSQGDDGAQPDVHTWLGAQWLTIDTPDPLRDPPRSASSASRF